MELTTESIGQSRSPMSATDLAHDDDDDDGGDEEDGDIVSIHKKTVVEE